MASRIDREKAKKSIAVILDKLKTEADPLIVNEYREVFKKEVSLFRRSWAAAYLLMHFDQAGNFRPAGNRAAHYENRGAARYEDRGAAHYENRGAAMRPQDADRRLSPEMQDRAGKNRRHQPATARADSTQASRADSTQTARADSTQASRADSTSDGGQENQARQYLLADEDSRRIFISIGRNRRVFPREIMGIIISKTGISRDDIGVIRILDNYSFVQVRDTVAEQIIDALNGYVFRGRTLVVNYAKNRKDEADYPAAADNSEITENSETAKLDEEY